MLFRYRGSEGMVAWAFHRIAGVAIWVMGGENPRFWKVIAAELPATPR